jgi:catechol 2,3-dioxygenase-like lactoylglutathione lyase family enzyme
MCHYTNQLLKNVLIFILAALLLGGVACKPNSQETQSPEEVSVSYTLEEAEKERQNLIARYIKNKDYIGFESEADGVNHLAFITNELESTIEFYTKVIRLKLLLVRAMDGDPQSTQVFFDMGRGELLAFLRLNNIQNRAIIGVGGFHHFALTITRDQYEEAKKRLDERKVPYTTISHEILDTITLTDPNGITIELSVWNIDSKKIGANLINTN